MEVLIRETSLMTRMEMVCYLPMEIILFVLLNLLYPREIVGSFAPHRF